MSVQAGIWNFDGKPVDRKLLANFSESLKQQGPDGEFFYVYDSIGLLYRPFHTTAESRREEQPYFSRRGFLLTWDGRLDNREELIGELRNDLEADPTDVAIVAACFERWETDCFSRIIGDWAVTIWRPQQRELTFAIDYMAIRHIFYNFSEDRIWWSTDLEPLVLLSGTKVHIDDDYIAGYFANDPDAHLTPYREIREVPPGQLVCIRDGRAKVEQYWRFKPTSRISYKTDAGYEEHFRHVFRQSVRRRLRSDSPILAELSGGLDSSSIVCMADDILAKEETYSPRLGTISYYDTSEPNGDDWIYFQKVEQHRGKTGAHIDTSKFGDSVGLEPEGFAALPGSLGAGRNMGVERAQVLEAGGYRAVLSGLGGDEFLGGVPNPTSQLADLILQFKFITLAKQAMAWSLVKRRPWIHLLWRAFLDLLPTSISQYLEDTARVEPWIQKGFARDTRMAVRQLDVPEHFGLSLPTRRSSIAGVLFMANKMSKRSPWWFAPEETRYPYLDLNLIEFILSIPANQLLRPGERRSLMRRSLRGIVLPEILSRRTKQFGARTPMVALKRNLPELQMIFSSPLSSSLGYVDQALFLEKLHDARIGKEVHLARLLNTISLEFWLRDLASRHLLDVPTGYKTGLISHAVQANADPSTTFDHSC